MFELECKLRVVPFVGENALRFIDDVARLRIVVFREFPYLYDGSFDYERKYLSTYMRDPESLILIAFDNNGAIRGASTAIPLSSERVDFQKPFLDKGIDTREVLYFGESIIEKSHRGLGTGKRFFDEREAYARRLARFTATCFCAVVRPPLHPQRPKGYEPLDSFWQRQGYLPIQGMQTTFSWKEVGEEGESRKTMQFWMKGL